MENIKIKVKDKEFLVERNSTLLNLIEKNMPSIKYTIIAARNLINGDIIELTIPIDTDIEIEWLLANSEEGLRILRHSASHIMAAAVRKVFPGTKVAIGPSTEDGFYYDFDSEVRFNEQDFEKIEKEMQNLINENILFIKSYLKREDAIKKFKSENEIYKIELLEEIQEENVSFYQNGDFIDLCRGPHVPSTGYIKAFKLLKVAGAYWRGNENNKMLQRIYGTAFDNNKSLKEYLTKLQEAIERDHRKIGKEMGLFAFYPEGPGFPFWKPNGMIIYNTIIEYLKEIHNKNEYLEVKTPIILNEELWHRSGHWDNYKENMYFTEIDNDKYAVKPMNCPGGLLIYKDGIHSYKELPLKIAELGLVHRHEKSGVLHGLFRVRQFTQDDAHIYCTKEQVKDEVKKVIELIKKIYDDFGFTDVNIELSTRPEKSIGTDEMWKLAENSLKQSLEELGISFKINPGDGAFYGPKIDFHIKDAIGRTWQCGTIQCDFSMPERFDINFIGPDGHKHRPVMIHRAILGSIERFIGILIEHYKGKFPFWLVPEQIRLLPISEKQFEFAEKVKNLLKDFNFRVKIDKSEDKLGTKIKNARVERVYFVGIIGDKEIESESVSLRKSDREENNFIKLNDLGNFLNDIKKSKT